MSKAYGPYSPYKKAGNLVYTAGQVGIDPDTKQAGSSLEEQVVQLFKNLEGVLKEAGSDLSKVVKTTCFLVDMNDYDEFNKLYARYYPANGPARSAVAVKELPRVAGDVKLLVEIEAVAEL
jgi:2-iminobutanoate/2-iminopropanoate deaminase